MFKELCKNMALRQAFVFLATGLIIWTLALHFGAYDRFTVVTGQYHLVQAKEVILAFVIAGLLGFIFSLFRVNQLQAEISRRYKAENDVTWIAQHDILTRLPNRLGLSSALGEMETKGPRETCYAVYSVDLVGFKRVNDLLGHQSGDEALIEVAGRLKEIFGDNRVFRLGGDEFVAFRALKDGVETEADALANRLVDRLMQPYTLSGLTIEMGASVGIAVYPQDGKDFQSVLRSADLAMYAAKKDVKANVARFEPFMNEAMVRRSKMEKTLRQAIKAKKIEPYYQPLMDLRSRELRGFEALARWVDVDGQFIPPAEFVAVAEDAGLIMELTDQLFYKACADATTWPSELRLAFNISPTQLSDKLLGLRILKTLSEVGLSPTRLELEITETALFSDYGTAEAFLASMHAAGIHIALDDFGTGYSSLSQLSKFKFDKIKIDRSFIDGFEKDERRKKIVRAMLGLGRGLGISTTAEGIETESQLKSLEGLGCEYGQGYLFGKAIPGADVIRFIETSYAAGHVAQASRQKRDADRADKLAS